MKKIFLASLFTIHHLVASQNDSFLAQEHDERENISSLIEFFPITVDIHNPDLNNTPRSPVNSYMERIIYSAPPLPLPSRPFTTDIRGSIYSTTPLPLQNLEFQSVINHVNRSKYTPYVPILEELPLNEKVVSGINKRFTTISAGLPTKKPRNVTITATGSEINNNDTNRSIYTLKRTTSLSELTSLDLYD